MAKIIRWFVVLLLFCCIKSADAQSAVLSVPFICQWANVQGGCPGNGWEQGIPDATSPADDNCGPTSILMVASKWSGSTPTGDDISQTDNWLQSNFGATWGYLVNGGKGSGTEPPELASLARNYFGLTDATEFSGWTLEQLKQELAQGYPVIVRVSPQMVASYPSAHYMVLLGMDQQWVYVNDPGIRRGAQAKYRLQDFIDSWARTAQWDHNNNEGVAIHAAMAPPLLGTDMPTTNSGGEVSVASYQFLAQQFTVTTPLTVKTISLQMSGFGTDPFTLWLTNAVGPGASASNVLFQTNLVFPSTGGGINGSTVSASANLTLNPGTYFLVLSAGQTSIYQGWILSTSILPSQVGSVPNQLLGTTLSLGGVTNSQFPPSSTFKSAFGSPVALAFQIFGTP